MARYSKNPLGKYTIGYIKLGSAEGPPALRHNNVTKTGDLAYAFNFLPLWDMNYT